MNKKSYLLLLLPIILSSAGYCNVKRVSMDSLMRLLQSASEDTNRVNLLYQISELSVEDKDFLAYAQQAYHLAEKLGYKKGLGDACNNIGGYYYNIGDLSTALEYYKKGLNYRNEINDRYGIAQSINNAGTVYEKLGDVVHALDSYLKSLKIREEINDKDGIATSLNNASLLYKSQGETQRALEYMQKCLKIMEEIGNNAGVAMVLNNIGLIYQDQGSSAKAIENFERSSKIYEEMGNKQGFGVSLHNIGCNYSKQGIDDKALIYFNKSSEILKKAGDKSTLSASMNNMAIIHQRKKNFIKAEKYSINSLEIARSIGVPERIRNSSETLSRIYSSLGKYKEAYQMQVLFKQMADSINNTETRKSAVKKQMQYEADKKEQQITLLNKDKLIQKKEIGQQTVFRNAAIIISVFLLVIGFLFFNRARTNKKYSEVLEEKNKIIEQEKEKAVMSEHYKTQFLTNMSHEIRTPLHAIIGMINVLNQRSPRDDQSAYLNVMRKSSESLISVINNVLDISKIEAGKIAFEKIEFSPEETLNTVVNLLQANATDKGIVLKPGMIDLPDFVEGDQVRLTQVLLNLIGNALKFTTEGEVTVSGESLNYHSGSNDKDQCIIQFTIKDTGVGIAEDKLGKIFESFTQAEEGITRKFGGTGLGLTISKQLVELQGGSIHVTSELGKGTSFYFMIPYGVVGSRASLTPEVTLNTENLNGSRVLIVEDNYYNRIVATETLNMILKDLVIDEAENGEIAVNKIMNQEYDFIFMDLQMPVMDGYTAMKKLRESIPEKIASIYIIGLSANASADEKEKCIAAGMHDYLSKPFNPRDLLKVMITVKDKMLA